MKPSTPRGACRQAGEDPSLRDGAAHPPQPVGRMIFQAVSVAGITEACGGVGVGGYGKPTHLLRHILEDLFGVVSLAAFSTGFEEGVGGRDS